MSTYKPVPTPCIGVCSTGIGDIVCRGCNRFAHEVIGWNGYSNEQRRLINDRLALFLEQILSSKVEINDKALLLSQLRYQQIVVDEGQSAYCWLYALLRAGAGQIDTPARFGFSLKAPWQNHSIDALKREVESAFYTLSCAHYERFIDPVR